ncbi:MAG: NTP transferase domain-containing protein, partial [Halocynthiibacter sp.]
MLFAAGFGTRMKSLTKERPKPLIEVSGKPLLDHALDQFRDLRDLKLVVNT